MNKKTYIIFAVVILFIALLVRVWVIRRNPIPAGDGVASNILLADNLQRGLGFNTFVKWSLYDSSEDFLRAEANRQPFLSFTMAPVFRLFGVGILQAQFLALLYGLLAMILSAYWAKLLFGRQASLIMLAYLAIDPPFIWYSTQTDSLMLYIALFYLILIVAHKSILSFKRIITLGFLAGLLFMTRTQGAMIVPALAVWIWSRKGEKRWHKIVVFGAIALIVISPWLVRNMNEFGTPTYSQNSQFLLNENHWSAWSVRDTAPAPTDMWRNQGPVAVASYLAAGVLRVIEPFTLGSTHRGEVFGQPTLVIFMIPAMLALFDKKTKKKVLLPALAITPVMLILVLHQHAGRYLSVTVPAIVALGALGFKETYAQANTKRKILVYWIISICLFILAAPVIKVLQTDNRARAAEALEATHWLQSNASDSAWVCSYPNVELFHWIYRKPTLAWPNDYEMLLWPYLENHNVQYMVVDRDLPTLRPWLSRCWLRTPDGRAWEIINPPPFITEVWRTESGNTIVYEFTGSVPEGYMAVDSLPLDNYRALGPH